MTCFAKARRMIFSSGSRSKLGGHVFRATRITAYCQAGGTL
jgi:hypothetical protein